MKTNDHRTPEQRKTHYWGVVGRDKFMSGWGGAKGGISRCAWACDSFEKAERVMKAVKTHKTEIIYVNIVDLRTYRPPKNTVHFAIYFVYENHTLLEK